MYTKCVRLSKLNCGSLNNIEKWLQTQCTCNSCQITDMYLEDRVGNTTITRHPKLTHHNLLLTSKMIIKIKLEIEKQTLLQSTAF